MHPFFATAVDNVLRLVVVALDGRAFALPIAAVERVVRMVDVTPLRHIGDLLEFSRMGRPEMHDTRIDLGALAQDGIRELEMATRGRSIEWKVASPSGGCVTAG